MATAAISVKPDTLADQIEQNREDMRLRRFFPIGKMLQLFLGPDDDARYMRNPNVRERITALSKVRGLQLDWTQHNAPMIAWNHFQTGCVFPHGLYKPPRIADPRKGFEGKSISQALEDHASGVILGRDRTQFMVLHPVMFLGIWPFGVAALFRMIGHADPVTGKYPALLASKDGKEGHIIYGVLELTNATSAPPMNKPWEHKGPAGV
jgi:hypothetical protein